MKKIRWLIYSIMIGLVYGWVCRPFRNYIELQSIPFYSRYPSFFSAAATPSVILWRPFAWISYFMLPLLPFLLLFMGVHVERLFKIKAFVRGEVKIILLLLLIGMGVSVNFAVQIASPSHFILRIIISILYIVLAYFFLMSILELLKLFYNSSFSLYLSDLSNFLFGYYFLIFSSFLTIREDNWLLLLFLLIISTILILVFFLVGCLFYLWRHRLLLQHEGIL